MIFLIPTVCAAATIQFFGQWFLGKCGFRTVLLFGFLTVVTFLAAAGVHTG